MRRIPTSRTTALLGLATLVACASGRESPEAFQAVTTIRRYNQALPRAYAQAKAGLLAGTATGNELQRVDDVIMFLAQGKMVMDARQESFRAGPATFPEAGRALVECEEIWWYRHWIPSTGEVKQAPRRVRYRNLYKLAKVDGAWLVDRLEEKAYEQLQ